MRKVFGMHKAQVAALHELRTRTRARYVDMLEKTELTSDTFKFHVRKLVSLGYIEKCPDGLYQLTVSGKEYTNRLDKNTGLQFEQPKSSLLLVVRSQVDGAWHYIAHHRTREPFYGMWGIASARVPKGVELREAAGKALQKQVGLQASFEVVGSLRVIDKNQDDTILEDKLFCVLKAELPSKVSLREWCGGRSEWMSRDELLAQTKLFQTTALTLDMVEQPLPFAEAVCVYGEGEY